MFAGLTRFWPRPAVLAITAARAAIKPRRTRRPTAVIEGTSFDHLVGAGEQRGWDNESNCPRGLQIDAQIKLIGLLNGEIRRTCTAQDSINVGRTASKQFSIVSAVGQEAAARSGRRKGVDRRHAVT